VGKLESGHEVKKFQGVSLGLLQAIKSSPDASFTILEPECADSVHIVEPHLPRRLVMIGRNIIKFSREKGEAIPKE
jgi:hypothetical protein